jgi:hypothetical protein
MEGSGMEGRFCISSHKIPRYPVKTAFADTKLIPTIGLQHYSIPAGTRKMNLDNKH